VTLKWLLLVRVTDLRGGNFVGAGAYREEEGTEKEEKHHLTPEIAKGESGLN